MDIPVWLDNLVCQLLEKKPEHRPFDAVMVAKVLEESNRRWRTCGRRVGCCHARTDAGRNRPAMRPTGTPPHDTRAVAKRKLRRKSCLGRNENGPGG